MPGATPSIEDEPDQEAGSARPDTINSQRSSRRHALPIQRWRLPSVCPKPAFRELARRRLRTVIDETEVLLRVGKGGEAALQHLQYFEYAQPDHQRDGQVPPGNQHDGRCNSGLRKSATGKRKGAP